MSFQKSSAAVNSDEALPLTEEALEKNYDILSDKCTCVEKFTCNYCCIQEYKKAWSELRKPFITEKSTSRCSEVIQKQEIRDCHEDKKCDTDIQCPDKLTVKREVDHVNSDSNCCLSEKTKDGQICDNLERSFKSYDSKTVIYSDCPIKQELIERTDAETCTDAFSQNSKRTRRSTKRKRDLKDSCPVCGLTIRFSDLESHFAKEVENLSKIPKHVRKTRSDDTGVNTTFVQVKCNRENRLSAKVAKYTKKTVNQVHCPVCSLKLTGSEDEINEHVLHCTEDDGDSDINITDRDDSFEEYEFGNETRVRAISFVPGGYRALLGYSSISKTSGDNDEDLNVDVDDTFTYGKPQYTELDVIHNLTDDTEDQQLEQLRKAVLIDPIVEPNILETRKWSITSEKKNEDTEKIACLENTDESNVDNKSECTDNKDKAGNDMQVDIISSLKEKIKNLEEQNKSVKCLICLEPYTKPVVSTTCWHVHCEECWLMTMGVKKLCPQCNLIVFPSDLRRIYL